MHHDQLQKITYCGLGTLHDLSSSRALDQGNKYIHTAVVIYLTLFPL